MTCRSARSLVGLALCLLASVDLWAPIQAQQSSSGVAQCDGADVSLAAAHTWADLSGWFGKFGNCKTDGRILLPVTSWLIHKLAAEPRAIAELARLANRTPAFGDFVLRSLGCYCDLNEMQRMASNTRLHCSGASRRFCSRLREAAAHAYQEAVDERVHAMELSSQ